MPGRPIKNAMTRAELLALPASVPTEVAFRAFGIGRTTGYAQLRDGTFPARVLRLGGTYRVVTADIWEQLGITPDEQAGGDAA